MLNDPTTFTSRFANRYGEEWLFVYDHCRNEGVLSGSDVDWQEYRVVGGRAAGLILNEEELQWLRRTWLEATGVRKAETEISKKTAQRIPVNCFWIGGSFLDYCAKQGWMIKQREGRNTRYYCTPAGVEALKQFGIEVLRPEERKRKSRTRRSTE
jgi:hypothetical protein